MSVHPFPHRFDRVHQRIRCVFLINRTLARKFELKDSLTMWKLKGRGTQHQIYALAAPTARREVLLQKTVRTALQGCK